MYSEICNSFLTFFAAIFAAILSSGLVTHFLTIFRQQRELVALFTAFMNECNYNAIHRGSPESPFQLEWLTKILSVLDFHEQCPLLAQKSLETFELAKDTNTGQLSRRKLPNGVSLVPSHVQNLMSDLRDDISNLLPTIRKRATLMGYIIWKVTGYPKLPSKVL